MAAVIASGLDFDAAPAPAVSPATSLWRAEPLLTGSGLALLALAIPAAAAIWLDPRTITNAPAWLKPMKFAISTGIYSVTLAWLFTWIPESTRTRRIAGSITVAVFALEIAIIYLQAWRGTASHFNTATPLDSVLFSVMGTAILVQTGAAAAVAVALWRQRFADPATGWALRLGMTITLVGALTGGLMARPTAAQLADARAGQPMTRVGAHTVGAPDGGPGLPLTGWSTRHGDLRVPHFVGLHAVQFLAFVAFAVRRRSTVSRSRAIVAAAALYGLVFAVLLGQALAGMPAIGGRL
jgi:hypothetical protein